MRRTGKRVGFGENGSGLRVTVGVGGRRRQEFCSKRQAAVRVFCLCSDQQTVLSGLRNWKREREPSGLFGVDGSERSTVGSEENEICPRRAGFDEKAGVARDLRNQCEFKRAGRGQVEQSRQVWRQHSRLQVRPVKIDRGPRSYWNEEAQEKNWQHSSPKRKAQPRMLLVEAP